MISLYNVTNPGSVGWQLRDVKQKVAKHLRCSNAMECDLNELVALQWGSSGVTGNVSSMYDSPHLRDAMSLQEWLPLSNLSEFSETHT